VFIQKDAIPWIPIEINQGKGPPFCLLDFGAFYL